ncbi:MAG: DUF432 domain-containing protein [Planctomycetes bacterium]|nr:DUF432 domain-containing protein [Planctomycetota bacterium]
MKNFWEAKDVGDNTDFSWEIGQLKLLLKGKETEWSIKHILDNKDDNLWERWIGTNNVKQVSLRPIMPDLPLVVKSSSPVVIIPNSEIQIYISIPLFVKLELSNNSIEGINEYATIPLSQTWFGDAMVGSHAYSLKTEIYETLNEITSENNQVICPILVKNITKKPFRFERLCLHVEHLSIYEMEQKLYADSLKVSYRGEEGFSKIEYSPGIDDFSKKLKLIEKSRNPIQKSIFKRSFSEFQNFHGFQL